MVTKIKNIFLISLLLISNICIAEDKFWVGGSGNWSDDDNHWATSSGGLPADGNIPTMIDDVYFDSKSHNDAYTLTIDGQADMKSMLWANPSSGTTTLAGSSAINIYGSLELPTDMDWQYAGTLTMGATTTGNTITTNGVVMYSNNKDFTLNGAGGEWSLTDDFNSGDNSATYIGLYLKIQQGTFNTNNHNVSVGRISQTLNSAVDVTWNLGSSTITTHGCNILSNGGSLNATANLIVTGTSEIILKCLDSVGSRVLLFNLGKNVNWNKITFYRGYDTWLFGSIKPLAGYTSTVNHFDVNGSGSSVNKGLRFANYATTTIHKWSLNNTSVGNGTLLLGSLLPIYTSAPGAGASGIHNPGVVWETYGVRIGSDTTNTLTGGIVKTGGGRWFIGRNSVVLDTTSSTTGYIQDYYRRQLMRRR